MPLSFPATLGLVTVHSLKRPCLVQRSHPGLCPQAVAGIHSVKMVPVPYLLQSIYAFKYQANDAVSPITKSISGQRSD